MGGFQSMVFDPFMGGDNPVRSYDLSAVISTVTDAKIVEKYESAPNSKAKMCRTPAQTWKNRELRSYDRICTILRLFWTFNPHF